MNQLRTIGNIILRYHPNIFSLEQIIKTTKLDRKTCRDILWTFCEEGFVKLISKKKKVEKEYGQPPSYVFHFKPLNKKALTDRIAPRRFEKTIEDRMWNVIFNKNENNGSFCLRDLTVLSGAKRGTSRCYLKALRRAGIIIPSRSGGGPGVEWRLSGKFRYERPYLDRSRKKR